MRKRRNSGAVMFSFAFVVVAIEVVARMMAPDLPVDPGEWPRVEIAQKLEQMRSYADEGKPVDVVFAGSSMMASGIDPVAFTGASGESSYNAGFAGPSARTI